MSNCIISNNVLLRISNGVDLMLFDFMDTGDLIRLACTSVHHQRQVRSYLENQQRSLLRRFFGTGTLVDGFLSLFGSIQMILSGSFVNQFATDRSPARDLDIYVTYEDSQRLVECLLNLGYQLIVDEPPQSYQYNTFSIIGVSAMINRDLEGMPTIDVVSCALTPVHTVLHFHSTQVSLYVYYQTVSDNDRL